MTASQLVQLLGLEKSSVSRMLARLIAAGELEEVISTEDARAKSLRLTAKGHETVSKINTFSNERVVTAIKGLAPAQQQTISEGSPFMPTRCWRAARRATICSPMS
jgi:DNA-binding MarR family transcriptional regulator